VAIRVRVSFELSAGSIDCFMCSRFRTVSSVQPRTPVEFIFLSVQPLLPMSPSRSLKSLFLFPDYSFNISAIPSFPVSRTSISYVTLSLSTRSVYASWRSRVLTTFVWPLEVAYWSRAELTDYWSGDVAVSVGVAAALQR
jgi:hypothetical protein